MLPITKILCPTDFSQPSYEALEAAKELALHFSAELILMNVVTPIPVVPASPDPTGVDLSGYQLEMVGFAKESMETLLKERIPPEITARHMVFQGNPADEIVHTASQEEVDMIVIATHGLTGWRRFIFGSVAEKVVRLSPRPVLTITAPKGHKKG